MRRARAPASCLHRSLSPRQWLLWTLVIKGVRRAGAGAADEAAAAGAEVGAVVAVVGAAAVAGAVVAEEYPHSPCLSRERW